MTVSPSDVRFTPESGHLLVRLECPLCSDTVAKVGGPLQVSNYRIKRARRLNQSCATHRFLEPILRVGMRKFFLQQYLPKADIMALKVYQNRSPPARSAVKAGSQRGPEANVQPAQGTGR
jgi:hypothetical protein